MKKKLPIPKWLLIVDIVYAVGKVIKHVSAGAMNTFAGMLSKIPLLKNTEGVEVSQPKLITLLLIIIIVLNIIFLIRNRKRTKMVKEVSGEVLQEIQQAKAIASTTSDVQKMDLFG